MSIYQENLNLVKNNPLFLEAMEGDKAVEVSAEYHEEAHNFTVEFNQKRFWLCSPNLNNEEVQHLLQHVPDNAEVVVVFGLGFGELLPYLHSQRSMVKHLIVIEPLQEVFCEFLKRNSIRSLFNKFGKVSFIVNQNENNALLELKRVLEKEKYYDLIWGFSSQTSYKHLFPEYEKGIVKTLYTQKRFVRVNENTNWALQRMWTMNFWRNLAQPAIKAEVFANIFKGKSVIIVSAGPSLQKNMHLLEKAKEKAIVIAVGSAITILENKGIKPHFRMMIDPVEENAEILKDVDKEDQVPLLYSDTFFFRSLAEYRGPKIHICLNSGGAIGKYFLDKIYRNRKIFRSGFSVANVAYDVAAQLGAKCIILTGQDLCFTGGRMHADGAWDQEIEEKIISTEMEAIDFQGNRVYTNSAFLGMREIFEVFIPAHAATTECINASEGGLPIKGAANRPLLEALEQLPVTEQLFEEQIQIVVKEEYGKIKNAKTKENKKIISEFARKIYQLHCLYQKLLKKYRELIERYEEKDLSDDKSNQIELEKLYKQIEKNKLYHLLVVPVYKNVHLRRRKEVSQKDDFAEKDRLMMLLNEVHEVEELLRMNLAFSREYCGGSAVNISFEK